MLRLFPGRTLEELDGIDLARLKRALDAQHIERLEQTKRLFLDGKLEPDAIPPADWLEIRDYEAALDEFFGEGNGDQ